MIAMNAGEFEWPISRTTMAPNSSTSIARKASFKAQTDFAT
jgi:hypothetical protein